MRIVMLGHSNAGKTTYMSMMYQYMSGRKGHNGFRIEASDGSQHTRLLENATAISRGKYPDPTSRRDTYNFRLYFEGRQVSDFVWADYRGGALTERSSDEDMAALLDDMKQSDAVVVFADAHELATDPDSRRRVATLTVLLQRAIADQHKATPVVLAYTKADLLRKSEEWSVAVEPFEQVSRALETSSNVKGTIVTVACGQRPKAVHVPVLWCLSHGVVNKIAALREDVAYWQREADSAGKKASISNSFKSWLDSVESERKKQLRYLKEAKERLAQLEPLLRPAEKLKGTLAKAQRKDGPPRAFRKATGR